MNNTLAKMRVIDLGRTSYKQTWDLQEKYFRERVDAKVNPKPGDSYPDLLIMTEHNPVYTIGKSGKFANLKVDEAQLGAEFYHINRGGDITFHGPGQLVVYPILDLERLRIGLARYIWLIEETVVKLIAEYGLKGHRLEGASGVWLDIENPFKVRKICAVGVRASRHITMHGLAFNVNTDLNWFEKIVPCGLPGKGVTSLQKETGSEIDMSSIKERFVSIFQELLSAENA